jgi:hypothetical protein
VDQNQPPKFNEDDGDDVEGGDLDAKFLVCDFHEKKTKLDVVLYVIFYETPCEGCASHVLEENFRTDGVEVDFLVL